MTQYDMVHIITYDELYHASYPELGDHILNLVIQRIFSRQLKAVKQNVRELVVFHFFSRVTLAND